MSRGCRQSSSARSFLRWLAGPESVTAAARQDAGLLLNSTLEEAPGIGWPDYDKQVASQLNSPMGNEAFLRIRGADRYLKALDSAVLKALSGEVTPTAALGAAATEWSAITKELGLESQQAQWRHSIGLL